MDGMRTTGQGLDQLMSLFPVVRTWLEGVSTQELISVGGLTMALVSGILLLVLNREERSEVASSR